MAPSRLDDLPGFRRRFEVTPQAGRVRTELEDDYHRMAVEISHDGAVATEVRAEMVRVPWTTCPGAQTVIADTFRGAALAEFPARGAKLRNCTHLYDLALLGAAHAGDGAPLAYDILVSDAVEGRTHAELRRDGAPVLAWTLEGGRIVDPVGLVGIGLAELGPWIAGLEADRQEHARLLRWGTILAHGRAMSDGRRSDKSRLPIGQCHTFQPDNAPRAQYLKGRVRDFSGGADGPLAKHEVFRPSKEEAA